jgi:hypothetical protein
LDFRAATPLIRRTLIIIHTGTIDARTFTIILIPITVRRIMGIVDIGPTTATIAIIITNIIELA